MAGERRGMNPDMVHAHAGSVRAHAGSLDVIADQARLAGLTSLNPLEHGLIPGLNVVMAPGSIALAMSAAADIDAAADSAREMLGRLVGEIAAQLQASSATDGYADAVMSKSDADRLYADALDDPSVLEGLHPSVVKAWWDQLSDEQREEFVREQPRAAGNTDGIPLAVRAEANWRSAVQDLGDPTITQNQREYLERVRDGDVVLVAYDPEADRIIEAIGLGVMDFREDPDNPKFIQGATWGENGELVHLDPPTRVLTYVPGTGSDLETFYSEENYQNFVHGIINGKEDSTVAFVYKGGPFASDLDEAKSQPYTLETGQALASFTEAIDLEVGISQADHIAIGHSWGLANVTASEVAGAHYDGVISLAGAWMPDGWEPNVGTDYTHFSYADWLRGVQVLDRDVIPTDVIGSGNFPGDNPAFDRHVYSSPNDAELIPGNPLSLDEWVEAKDAWLDNHELIHQPGNPANSAASQDIREAIYG
ncbi:MAG: hypothetical protein M3Y46_03130 [Actinomycetota bacterium]|nr:hypothetical protein [Actinomycetota bacterium]